MGVTDLFPLYLKTVAYLLLFIALLLEAIGK